MHDQTYTPALITPAIRGDDAALSFLYESTQDKVTQTVRSMIRDEDAVLDIVQDSFVKAFRSLDKLDRPEHFLAWIRRIATNTAVDYLKKKRPVLFSELASEDGTEIEFEDENIGHLPDVLLDQKETSRLIQEIVSGLSEEQHLAIGLFYFEEMPIKSIAQKLGCSENTVKSRLNYGRKNIEKQVRELEKKGTKLYSLAPLPFFLWLLRSLHTQPSQDMLRFVLVECSSSISDATPANHIKANAGVKAAASVSKKLAIKIAVGIVTVATVGLGAVLVFGNGLQKNKPAEASISVDTGSETTAGSTSFCDVNGHTWVGVTCETAKTCSVCGETDGEAMGHTWVEADHQLPKTCSVCGLEEGDPLTPDFVENGIPVNVTGIGTEYDYLTSCMNDPTKDTVGKMHIAGYSIFDADESHEAVDGYEWRVVTVQIVFDDENASKYGLTVNYFHDDFYTVNPWGSTQDAAGAAAPFTVRYNGKFYSDCLYFMNAEWSEWEDHSITLMQSFHFRVPVGYDGCVIGYFDSATSWGEGTYTRDILDENSLVFRLN